MMIEFIMWDDYRYDYHCKATGESDSTIYDVYKYDYITSSGDIHSSYIIYDGATFKNYTSNAISNTASYTTISGYFDSASDITDDLSLWPYDHSEYSAYTNTLYDQQINGDDQSEMPYDKDSIYDNTKWSTLLDIKNDIDDTTNTIED